MFVGDQGTSTSTTRPVLCSSRRPGERRMCLVQHAPPVYAPRRVQRCCRILRVLPKQTKHGSIDEQTPRTGICTAHNTFSVVVVSSENNTILLTQNVFVDRLLFLTLLLKNFLRIFTSSLVGHLLFISVAAAIREES